MSEQQQYRHNDFIFRVSSQDVSLIRDFEGMYAHCEDPHDQSRQMSNVSYQLVSTTLERAVNILTQEEERSVSIIDVGCGLGYFTAHLKEKFPDAYVYGIDISASAIEKAETIAPNCTFKQVDIRSPDITINGSGKFDVAIALDSLYYFKDDEIGDVLTNIRTLLARDGFIMVGYHLPEDMRFGLYLRSLDDARALFKSYGMDIVYSFDVENDLDLKSDDTPVGRHLYFLARIS